MNDIQKQMLEVLEETKNFYSKDPSRRATQQTVFGMACTYQTSNGNRCGVSRYLKEGFLEAHPEVIEDNPGAFDLIADYGSPMKLLNEHPKFWNMLQLFHDDRDNWDGEGLTERGEVKYRLIKQRIITVM